MSCLKPFEDLNNFMEVTKCRQWKNEPLSSNLQKLTTMYFICLNVSVNQLGNYG